MITTSSTVSTSTVTKTISPSSHNQFTTEAISIKNPGLDVITTHAIAAILGGCVILFCTMIVLLIATLCYKLKGPHSPQHNPGVLNQSGVLYDQPSNDQREPTETIDDTMFTGNQEQEGILLHNPAYSVRQREDNGGQMIGDGPVYDVIPAGEDIWWQANSPIQQGPYYANIMVASQQSNTTRTLLC